MRLPDSIPELNGVFQDWDSIEPAKARNVLTRGKYRARCTAGTPQRNRNGTPEYLLESTIVDRPNGAGHRLFYPTYLAERAKPYAERSWRTARFLICAERSAPWQTRRVSSKPSTSARGTRAVRVRSNFEASGTSVSNAHARPCRSIRLVDSAPFLTPTAAAKKTKPVPRRNRIGVNVPWVFD